MASKAQIRATEKWNKEHTDLIRIKPRKELDLPNKIEMAVNSGFGDSRQDYIIKAICEKLERDGILSDPDVNQI